ncbi:MAG: helix-hairpin-helix domain-containing protein [Chloroflexota bacterium]
MSIGLLLLVGAALGAFIAFGIDNVYWGRRWQTAVSLQQKLKQQLRRASRRVAKLQVRGQQQSNALRLKAREADRLQQQTETLTGELVEKGKTLETAVSDLQMTQSNLTRVSEYNETLRQENDAWEEKYAGSEKALITIRTQLHNTQGELSAVRTEKEELTEKLLTTSAKLQSLTQLQEKVGRQREELAQIKGTLAQQHDKLTAQKSEAVRLTQEKKEVSDSLVAAEVQIGKLTSLAGLLREQETATAKLQTELQQAHEATAAAKSEQQMVQNEVLGLRRRVSEGQQLRKRLTAVSQELTAAKEEIDTLKDKLVAQNHIKHSVLHDKDNLTIIRGIGPAYARRLNAAGVNSLIDLAKMTPERVGEIVGVQNWQSRNVQAWIDEAQSLIASFSES